MNFEAYLISKKIDSAAFEKAEPLLWKTWNAEFESMHPNSFTTQKLYLINPIRRMFPLKLVKAEVRPDPETPDLQNTPIENPGGNPPSSPKPLISKPVFKPKPKIS